MPGVDVDDIYPILLSRSDRELGGDCLAYQRPNRRPERSNAKSLPGDPINRRRSIVPVTVDVNRRGIRHKHQMLGLNRGQLVERRLQHRGMSYHNKLRQDGPITDEESRPAATNLLADS